jgi:hypothetical protein
MAAEGQLIADAKAAELAQRSWEELDAYESRVEYVPAPSGRMFRVKSEAFWDIEEWASDLYISVKAYAPAGLRRFWRYKAWIVRPGEDLPPRPSEPSSG